MDTVPHGFMLVGDTTQRRRLVDAGAAFRGYAQCAEGAEVHREAYLSAFNYGKEMMGRANAAHFLDVAGYDGVVGADHLWTDIDRPDNLDLALTETKKFVSFALDRYRSLDEDHLLLFYSGSKGFHVGLPAFLFAAAPSTTFNATARHLVASLAEKAGLGIGDRKRNWRVDEAVFDKIRPFRAPNSRHQKTGLHKRRLSTDMLLKLSLRRIQEMARTPEPFDVLDPSDVDDRAADDWSAAAVWAQKQAMAKVRRDGEAPKLNRLTREIIWDGAEVGTRHNDFFSAAKNLGEFATVDELAHALLTEPGRNSGLAPKDIRRQIKCGLAAARKEREVHHE